MSYPTYRVATASPTRGKSPLLWAGALERFSEEAEGAHYVEDFVNAVDASSVDADGGGETRFAGQWTMVNSAAGGTNTNFATIADPTGAIGAARLTAASGTDWFGVSAGRLSKCYKTPKHTSDPRSLLIFEVRVDLSESDTYFLGLGEETSEFLSSTGTLPTDTDYIGFYRLNSGDLQFVMANDNNGGTAVTFAADILTDAAITALTDFVKLGFRVNADGSVIVTVNEEIIVTRSDTGALFRPTEGAIPIETLNQIYETQRGETGDLAAVTIDFDWIETFNPK